jgi:choline dehydrogenase-like flavoprotein
MFHPYASIYGYLEEETDGNRGPPLSLWSHQFYETDPNRGFVRGYSYQFGRGVGAILEAQQSMAVGRLPWGPDHHRVYRKLRNHRVSIAAICEDLPEEHNRVTLDPVLKDGNGIPAPKIDYTISENSHRMLDHAIARATEILKEADPSRSVVNGWGRTHDVKNLFIIDGSVFTTSGGVNPTSTIQAIALYVADQMKQRLATLFD